MFLFCPNYRSPWILLLAVSQLRVPFHFLEQIFASLCVHIYNDMSTDVHNVVALNIEFHYLYLRPNKNRELCWQKRNLFYVGLGQSLFLRASWSAEYRRRNNRTRGILSSPVQSCLAWLGTLYSALDNLAKEEHLLLSHSVALVLGHNTVCLHQMRRVEIVHHLQLFSLLLSCMQLQLHVGVDMCICKENILYMKSYLKKAVYILSLPAKPVTCIWFI